MSIRAKQERVNRFLTHVWRMSGNIWILCAFEIQKMRPFNLNQMIGVIQGAIKSFKVTVDGIIIITKAILSSIY